MAKLVSRWHDPVESTGILDNSHGFHGLVVVKVSACTSHKGIPYKITKNLTSSVLLAFGTLNNFYIGTENTILLTNGGGIAKVSYLNVAQI